MRKRLRAAWWASRPLNCGAGDPVQQPAGVVDLGVGAHEIEHRPGVVDEVVGQPEGGGDGVGADGAVPAIAEVVGEVQEGGEAAGGAGELGCPAGQMGEVTAAAASRGSRSRSKASSSSPAWGRG